MITGSHSHGSQRRRCTPKDVDACRWPVGIISSPTWLWARAFFGTSAWASGFGLSPCGVVVWNGLTALLSSCHVRAEKGTHYNPCAVVHAILAFAQEGAIRSQGHPYSPFNREPRSYKEFPIPHPLTRKELPEDLGGAENGLHWTFRVTVGHQHPHSVSAVGSRALTNS